MILHHILVASICAFAPIMPAAAIPQSAGTTATTATTSADPASSSGASGATFTDARITFYNAGLGACGETNSDSEDILALTTEQWDNGAHCNQVITITANGKTKDAVIKDRTFSLPVFFADQGLGHIQGEWSFKDGDTTNVSQSGSSAGSTDPAQTTSVASTTSVATVPSDQVPGIESSPTLAPGVTVTTSPTLAPGVTA
ncbi:hypothetical protein A7U60_g753 [Sanghuangporus baumii]|uniref:Uncharacterized protein n=1 Tax=Sanghuangporus baumii TaxID=108892 RepID=A0A9Q5NF68_SANBA|nr:hypothetical protein A7U60_g753 [Sanghuangporus baumii]